MSRRAVAAGELPSDRSFRWVLDYLGRQMMARLVKVTYEVWPTAAEMALASAQKFAETVEEAVAKRGVARLAISGGSHAAGYVQAAGGSGGAVCEDDSVGQAAAVLGG